MKDVDNGSALKCNTLLMDEGCVQWIRIGVQQSLLIIFFLCVCEQDWLTSEKMAAWIKENNLIKIVLRDSLHQPQYVEKLEKILRFVIKEPTTTTTNLRIF